MNIVRQNRGLYALLTAIPLGIASCGGGGGDPPPPTPPPTTDAKPSVSFTDPSNGAVITSTQMLVVNASDDKGVSKVDFFVGSTHLAEDTTSPYEYSWDTTSLQNGDYTLMAKATDTVDQETETSISVTVNNAQTVDNPPSVSITSPDGTQDLVGPVTIRASATDDNGVSSVEFFIDGTSLSVDASAPYEFSWDTTGVQNGDYTLSAIATDSANQESVPSSVTVTVNNPPPVDNPPSVSITSPDGTRNLSNIEAITASATDDNGVSSVEFFVDGTSLFVDNSSPYAASWDTTAVTDGTYTILVRATDSIGQTNDDTLSVDVVNAVACRDVSEDEVPDCDSDLITIGEFVVYPDAIWGYETNSAVVAVCSYMDSAIEGTISFLYSPDNVGASNTPNQVEIFANDDGVNGDFVAGDLQYCASIDLQIPEPTSYRFASNSFDTIEFSIRVYDADGTRLAVSQLANDYPEVGLTLNTYIFVTNPDNAVTPSQITASAKATSHVVNILDPGFPGCSFSNLQQAVPQLYGLFPTTPDPFDQIVLLKAGKSYRHANPVSFIVKDDITHNGGGTFDSSSLYGSAGKLRGIACMGNDLMMTAVTHEYAHPFVQYEKYLRRGHYFQSDDFGPLATGGILVEDGPGWYKRASGGYFNNKPYSKMTMRAMSLLCENEFGEVRFANRYLGSNERIPESETTVETNATLVQEYGPMNPACNQSQTARVLFLVMSNEGFASDAYISAMHALAVYHSGNYPGGTTPEVPYTTSILTGSIAWAAQDRLIVETLLPPTN